MIRRLVLISVMLLTFVSAGQGKDPRTMQFPATLDFIPHKVERDSLSNGIQVFLAENHEVPLIDINIVVTLGEDHVPSEYAGLSRILVDLIAEGGSVNTPERVFKDSLENIGASFRGYSSSRETGFNLHMLSEYTSALLPLVVDALRDPALPQPLLDINKRQYLVSYQGRNTEPSSIAGRVYDKLVYGQESPVSREVTPASLADIDIPSLDKFHRANYRPRNIMIGVSGDFDPQAMLDLLERLFGDWQEPEAAEWETVDLIAGPASPGVYVVQWPGSIQSNIYLGYLGIMLSDPGYPRALMLSEIYGASWSSRVHSQVREQRGLAYHSAGYISGGRTIPGPFQTVCVTKAETTVQAIEVILDIISDLQNNGVTGDELILAKDSWLAAFPQFYSEPEQVMRSQMSYIKDGYPIDFQRRLLPAIEEVTVDDVNEFATGFLDTEDLIILVVGDTALLDGSLSQFGEVTVIDTEEY